MGAGANNLVVVYFKDATPVDAIHMVALKKASANVKKAMKCVHREKRLRGGEGKNIETSGKKTSNYKKGMVGAAAVVGTMGLAALGRHLYLKNRATSVVVPSLQLSLHPTQTSSEQAVLTSLHPTGESLRPAESTSLHYRGTSLRPAGTRVQQAVSPSLHPTGTRSQPAESTNLQSAKLDVDKTSKPITEEQVLQNQLNNKCFTTVKKLIGEKNTQIRQDCKPQTNNKIIKKGSELGYGQFGIVYSVEDTEDYVIKEQTGFCYMFINEIRCLDLLNKIEIHNKIVPIIYDAYVCFPETKTQEDVTNIEVIYGYVMEKMDETLHDYLLNYTSHLLSETDLQELYIRITLICNVLDKANILHRDMTLYNFMFDKQRILKIIDFGLAYIKNTQQDHDSSLIYLEPLTDQSKRIEKPNIIYFVATTTQMYNQMKINNPEINPEIDNPEIDNPEILLIYKIHQIVTVFPSIYTLITD
jgi:tRNA A-37 threonylcarbamoyl transferase component Bud32